MYYAERREAARAESRRAACTGPIRAEATRIEREGGRVTRVVLDYELKRDYQKFLNREDRPEDSRGLDDDRQAFAQAQRSLDRPGPLLSCRICGSSTSPKTAGLSIATSSWSPSITRAASLAGKTKAGFVRYRSASSGGSRRQ